MATASLPRAARTRRIDADLAALAQEIGEDEGIGLPPATVLALLYRDGLTDYALAWDAWTPRERSERSAQCGAGCPVCGAALEGRQSYIGGRGYCYFDVCSGDGSHFARRA